MNPFIFKKKTNDTNQNESNGSVKHEKTYQVGKQEFRNNNLKYTNNNDDKSKINMISRNKFLTDFDHSSSRNYTNDNFSKKENNLKENKYGKGFFYTSSKNGIISNNYGTRGYFKNKNDFTTNHGLNSLTTTSSPYKLNVHHKKTDSFLPKTESSIYSNYYENNYDKNLNHFHSGGLKEKKKKIKLSSKFVPIISHNNLNFDMKKRNKLSFSFNYRNKFTPFDSRNTIPNSLNKKHFSSKERIKGSYNNIEFFNNDKKDRFDNYYYNPKKNTPLIDSYIFNNRMVDRYISTKSSINNNDINQTNDTKFATNKQYTNEKKVPKVANQTTHNSLIIDKKEVDSEKIDCIKKKNSFLSDFDSINDIQSKKSSSTIVDNCLINEEESSNDFLSFTQNFNNQKIDCTLINNIAPFNDYNQKKINFLSDQIENEYNILKNMFKQETENKKNSIYFKYTSSNSLKLPDTFNFFNKESVSFATKKKNITNFLKKKHFMVEKKVIKLSKIYLNNIKLWEKERKSISEKLNGTYFFQHKITKQNESIKDLNINELDSSYNLNTNNNNLENSSRRNRRHGDSVVTEAEFQEVLDFLCKVENDNPLIKAKKVSAKIPDLILDIFEKQKDFVNLNNLVLNKEEWVDNSKNDFNVNFSKEEVELFLKAFCIYPKKFGDISRHMEGKRTPKECLRYYYFTKKKFNYKQMLNLYKKKNGKKGGRRRKSEKLKSLISNDLNNDPEDLQNKFYESNRSNNMDQCYDVSSAKMLLDTQSKNLILS